MMHPQSTKQYTYINTKIDECSKQCIRTRRGTKAGYCKINDGGSRRLYTKQTNEIKINSHE